jgi:D-glycero-D-manno-heptose 1,7-bisphosphate phosphatase
MQRAVFLDRDNTLIVNDDDLGDPEQVQLMDGVAEGLKKLREAGFRLIVISNQGGVARGKFTEDDVDAVHQRIAMLCSSIAGVPDVVDRFYYCPYHPDATVEEYRRDHPWRKPNPGMLLQAARDLDIDLAASWMIGDQPRDVVAGRAAGCRTILVRHAGRIEDDEVQPTVEVESFLAAVEVVLEQAAEPKGRPAVVKVNGHGSAVAEPGSAPPARWTDRTAGNRELKRAMHELTEELRAQRLRKAEFTAFRMAAGLCQLLAVLLAVLGLLQMDATDVFLKWIVGAVLVQLLTITILILDARG